MDTPTEAGRQDKRTHLLRFSKSDVPWLVFAYVIGFMAFRFDMLSHGRWFRNPMPTAKAAWIALLFALAASLLIKIREAGNRVDE